MAAKKYNSEIDLAKFLFSIIIVLYHSNKLVAAEGFELLPFGYTATDFFFMVSGYLMVKSSKRYEAAPLGKSTFDFVFNKIKSFYPYLFFAFVVAFVVRQFSFRLEKDFSVVTFLKDSVLAINEVLLLHNTGIDFGKIYNGPTWYISAMIFSMAIIFPILLRFKEWFVNIGSLVIAVVCYAFTSQEKGTLNSLGWNGFTSMGILRAIAGLCLGCFLCALIDRVNSKEIVLKKKAKVLLWLAEAAMFALLLVIMQFEGENRYDYIAVILIFFICFIILSGLTGFKELLHEKLCSFLGKASLVIYFNHRVVIFFLNAVAPDLAYEKTILLYFVCSAVMAAAAQIVVSLGKICWTKISPSLKKAFSE